MVLMVGGKELWVWLFDNEKVDFYKFLSADSLFPHAGTSGIKYLRRLANDLYCGYFCFILKCSFCL